MADTDELSDYAIQRQQELQHARDVMDAQARIEAGQAKPAGSPTEAIGRGGQLRGPISYDRGLMLTPKGTTGLRGYPTAEEYAAANATNLANARADQFNSDVNATIGRYQPAPRFAMPSTDQLIDVGIVAKRNQLQNEIANRINRLPTESDQPIQVGRGHWAPSKATQTRAELAILTRAAGQLDSAQQSNIANRSKLALESAKQNEIAAQDTARSQVVDFMSNIDESRYPHGSPDRAAFIGRVFGNRPDWLHVMAKDKDLSKFVEDHVDAHKSVADTMAALNAQYGTKFVPKSISAKGGVTYNAVPDEKAIPSAVIAKHAKLLGDIQYHQEESAKEEAVNRAKPNGAGANTPYSKAAEFHAANTELGQLNEAYPKLSRPAVQIPQAAMDALREDPSRAVEFDRKFGKGSAEIILR